MATTLVPRLFGDFIDWFEMDRPQHPGHMIRVEDSLTEGEYHVRAELPGMDPAQDIAVSVDGGVLSIHAERHEQEERHGRSEFRYGLLERSVRLPGNADADHIQATYDKGILDVMVPLKDKESVGRKIPIATG
jgi:HSP20 family molecular chaperone IbpA